MQKPAEIKVLLTTDADPDGRPIGVWESLADAMRAVQAGKLGPVGSGACVERDYEAETSR
jgi:hypothetical protein